VPQTFTQLHYHVVFSTKGREPTLTPAVRPRVWEYLGGMIRGERGIPILVGGADEHVHLLFTQRQDVAVSDFVGKLKSVSSGWAHETIPGCGLWWQTGYAAFSVSHSAVDKVRDYIARQDEHHRKRTFQDEFRRMLRRHEVRSMRSTSGTEAIAAPRLG
jgi:REP element-mobilizing transposase RayT